MGCKFKCGVDSITKLYPSLCGEVCGDELGILDSIATEPARLAGTTAQLYSIRRAANRHPLYKEPSGPLAAPGHMVYDGEDWEFEGPWEINVTIDFPEADNISPEATEYGKRTLSEARMWIARSELERVESNHPKEGDVIRFWYNGPFAREHGETFWDVVKATKDGAEWSSEVFVQYYLELRRRGKFTAARKVDNTRI